MNDLPDANELLKTLDQVNYWEGFSPAARQKAEELVRMQLGPATELTSQMISQHPAAALLSVFGDIEAIFEAGAYKRVLKAFQSGSFGLFQPTRIRERWDRIDEEGLIDFEFHSNGQRFFEEIPYDGDYLSAEFFDLIDRATLALPTPMKFFIPPLGWGQDYGCVFCTPEAYERAVQAGLFPGAMPELDQGHVEPEGGVSLRGVQAPTDVETLWNDVEASGWLKGFPDVCLQALRAQVATVMDEARLHPATGLAVGRIAAGEPFDAEAAHALVHELRDKTRGHFAYDAFQVVEDDQGIDCFFVLGRQSYSTRPTPKGRGKRPPAAPLDRIFLAALHYYCEFATGVQFHKFTAENDALYLCPRDRDAASIAWMPSDTLNPVARRR